MAHTDLNVINPFASALRLASTTMGNPESDVPPEIAIPPLDPSLLTLTDDEKAFLHHAISSDDAELHNRIRDVQKR